MKGSMKENARIRRKTHSLEGDSGCICETLISVVVSLVKERGFTKRRVGIPMLGMLSVTYSMDG
jgi:hypothetical protein